MADTSHTTQFKQLAIELGLFHLPNIPDGLRCESTVSFEDNKLTHQFCDLPEDLVPVAPSDDHEAALMEYCGYKDSDEELRLNSISMAEIKHILQYYPVQVIFDEVR